MYYLSLMLNNYSKNLKCFEPLRIKKRFVFKAFVRIERQRLDSNASNDIPYHILGLIIEWLGRDIEYQGPVVQN